MLTASLPLSAADPSTHRPVMSISDMQSPMEVTLPRRGGIDSPWTERNVNRIYVMYVSRWKEDFVSHSSVSLNYSNGIEVAFKCRKLVTPLTPESHFLSSPLSLAPLSHFLENNEKLELYSQNCRLQKSDLTLTHCNKWSWVLLFLHFLNHSSNISTTITTEHRTQRAAQIKGLIPGWWVGVPSDENKSSSV